MRFESNSHFFSLVVLMKTKSDETISAGMRWMETIVVVEEISSELSVLGTGC